MTTHGASIPPAWGIERYRRGLTIGSVVGNRGIHHWVRLTTEEAAEMLSDAERYASGVVPCDPGVVRAAKRVVEELRPLVPAARPQCYVLETAPGDRFPFRVIDVGEDGKRRVASRHRTRVVAEAALAKHKLATGFTARFLKVHNPRPT